MNTSNSTWASFSSQQSRFKACLDHRGKTTTLGAAAYDDDDEPHRTFLVLLPLGWLLPSKPIRGGACLGLPVLYHLLTLRFFGQMCCTRFFLFREGVLRAGFSFTVLE